MDKQTPAPVSKTAAVRGKIALETLGDIANSFFVSFLPFPLVFASRAFAINGEWGWCYATIIAWGVISVIWGALLAITSFTIARCSLELGDPTGPDVLTPFRSMCVTCFHISVQVIMYRYVYA
ncbi:MAG: hypothetical protein Aurels2KO_38350 [Aureliella sp.]